MKKVSLLVLALTLALSSSAFAGGANCATKQTASAHDSSHNKDKAAQLAAKGWIGFKTEKNAAGGYRVTSVEAGSPAEQAGFRTGDVLVALNGIALTDANKDAVKKVKANLGVGKSVSYTVRRANAEQTLTATLAPVPEAVLAQWLQEEERTKVAQNAN